MLAKCTPLGICAVAVVLLTATMPSIAQNKPATPPTPSLGIDQQWEYIVVSYGKTLFGSPQKTLAYRAVGLQAGQEAPDLENSLDILGRFGWEVVTIVGSIGGDQQVVLKRKYNRNLVKTEYSAILKGKDLYIKDLIDIMEREQRLREEADANAALERNKPRLIDLDAAEALAARRAKESALIDTYKKAFSASELSKFSTADFRVGYGDMNVTITSDVTNQFLTNGSTYRKSEVKKFIDNEINKYKFVDPTLDRYQEVKIIVNATIQFGGKSVEVYSYKTSWSQILKRWD